MASGNEWAGSRAIQERAWTLELVFIRAIGYALTTCVYDNDGEIISMQDAMVE